jgi:outer membrane protein, heavy metal efflux system
VIPILVLLLVMTTDGGNWNAPAEGQPFSERDLATAIWRSSPELASLRERLVEEDANRGRARLFPNPTLDVTWGTIPLGERNPPEQPFSAVPNYTVQLGTTIEIGKRRPRQNAADAGFSRARLDLAEAHRQTFFAAMATLAAQAEAVARKAVLERLVADGAETLRLQRARVEKGDVAPLDVGRLEVEHLRLLSQVKEAAGTRHDALAACTRLVGTPCPQFSSAEQARRFLALPEHFRLPSPDLIERRADIQALAARAAEARAQGVLAHRQAIPDPTLAVGYTRDQFVVSGNQANSVNVHVSLPLPLFDRGQVDERRAAMIGAEVARTRETLIATARETVRLTGERLAVLADRAQVLDRDAIPRATTVLERTEAAAKRGGVALQDVLLVRRALEELELDRVEVAAEWFRTWLELRRTAGPPPMESGQ